MATTTSFKTVAVAGATGAVGFSIADELLKDGSYKVRIIRKKPESKSEKADLLASKGAEVVYVDYNQNDELVKAFKGIDVVVSAVNVKDMTDNYYSIQVPLIKAAKEAGVKRFIPSEFGGDYKPNTHAIIDSKYEIREELVKSGLEYTFIYTGLFQEYIEWFGFDMKNKTATFYVDGSNKINFTSIQDIGKFTVESLKLPEARNGTIRVAGSDLTFNEILQKFEEATGSKWKTIEDKEVRNRFKNKIEPIPSLLEDFKAVVCENCHFDKLDNDKFSFTPRPIDEQIKLIVKASK